MESLPMSSRRCPWCATVVDAVRPLQGRGGPQVGDVMFCVSCGEWAIETERSLLRKPTDEEFADIGLDTGCRQLRWAWLTARKRTGKTNPKR